MNLSLLANHMLDQLRTQQLIGARQTSQVGELKVGRVLVALVTEVSELAADERLEAIARLRQQLLAAQNGSDSNAAAKLKEQLDRWLQQPRLYLTELRAGTRQLFAIAIESLPLQQAVRVMVRPDGQLQLMLPTKAANVAGAEADINKLTAQAVTPLQQNLINATLRQTLPLQAPLKNLIAAVDQLSKMPNSAMAPPDKNVPAPIAQAAQKVQSLIPSVAMLSRPEGVFQALRQSGTLHESLVMGAKRSAPATNPTTSNNTPGEALSPSSFRFPYQSQSQAQTINAQAPTQPLTDPAETDLKAALLQLLVQVQSSAVTIATTSKAMSYSADNGLATLLGFKRAGATRPVPASNTNPVTSSQKISELQHHVTAALARIQTQQLQNLAQRSGDTGLQQQLSFELPVRVGDQLSTLAIQLQEFWEHSSQHQKQGENTRKPEQTRRWEVRMDFDLGQLGQLACQLKLTQQSVSALFWADKPTTLQLAQAQMTGLRQQMEASGLTVQAITCLDGLPPQRAVKVGYHLVDVCT